MFHPAGKVPPVAGAMQAATKNISAALFSSAASGWMRALWIVHVRKSLPTMLHHPGRRAGGIVSCVSFGYVRSNACLRVCNGFANTIAPRGLQRVAHMAAIAIASTFTRLGPCLDE
jgi:hypothetical protein